MNNFKRKVALLLVLVMVLAALPMNVFGNPWFTNVTPSATHRGWHNFHIAVPVNQGQFIQQEGTTSWAALFPIELTNASFYHDGNRRLIPDDGADTPGSLAGADRGSMLRAPHVSYLDNSHVNDLGDLGIVSEIASRSAVGVVLPDGRPGDSGDARVGFVARTDSNTSGWIYVELSGSLRSAIMSGAFNSATIQIPIRVNITDYGANAQVYVPSGGGGSLGTFTLSIPEGIQAAGISFSATSQSFANTLALQPIVVRDTAQDRMRNWPGTTGDGIYDSLLPRVVPGSWADATTTGWWYLNNTRMEGENNRSAHAGGTDSPQGTMADNTISGLTSILPGWAPGGPNWANWIGISQADQDRLRSVRPGRAQDIGWFTVRLVAPQHYSWAVDGAGGQLRADVSSPSGGGFISGDNHTGDPNVRSSSHGVRSRGTRADAPTAVLNSTSSNPGHGHNFHTVWEDGRHVAYVRVNAGAAEGNGVVPNSGARQSFIPVTSIIHINNLMLYPTAQAPQAGEVRIVAEHGWSARLGNPGDAWVRRGGTELVVGTRGGADVGFTVTNDVPVVTSGFLGDRRTGDADSEANRNPGNQALPHYRGVQTATVRLEESVSGAWGANWATPIDFTFGPGVQILGAKVQSNGHTGGDGNRVVNFEGWLGATDQRFAAHHGNVQLDPNLLRVFTPMQEITSIRNITSLDVTFYLSIEADYAEKYSTDAVEVTVSGTGVATLAGTSTLTVAHVQDPISVSLPGGAQEITTDAVHGTARTAISDVVVTVEDPTVLTHNSEIWLYVARPGGGLTEVFLEPGVTASFSTDVGGLQLAPARILQHPHPSFQRDGVAFTVNRPPNASTEPFDIIFSNLTIHGRLIQELDYQIVVSGTRIAQNDQVVRSAIEGGFGTAVPALNAGTFTSLPYARTILTTAAADAPGWYQPPVEAPPVVEPPFEPMLRPLTLRPGMAPVHTADGHVVENAYFLAGEEHGVGAPGFSIGVVNPRVFGHIVNVAADWDGSRGANGTAIIQGNDRHGNWMRVELPVGATTATIIRNGQTETVDLATAAPGSGDPGTVRTVNINERVFVPVRFLAEAFGYSVDTSDFPAVTIRP